MWGPLQLPHAKQRIGAVLLQAANANLRVQWTSARRLNTNRSRKRNSRNKQDGDAEPRSAHVKRALERAVTVARQVRCKPGIRPAQHLRGLRVGHVRHRPRARDLARYSTLILGTVNRNKARRRIGNVHGSRTGRDDILCGHIYAAAKTEFPAERTNSGSNANNDTTQPRATGRSTNSICTKFVPKPLPARPHTMPDLRIRSEDTPRLLPVLFRLDNNSNRHATQQSLTKSPFSWGFAAISAVQTKQKKTLVRQAVVPKFEPRAKTTTSKITTPGNRLLSRVDNNHAPRKTGVSNPAHRVFAPDNPPGLSARR